MKFLKLPYQTAIFSLVACLFVFAPQSADAQVCEGITCEPGFACYNEVPFPENYCRPACLTDNDCDQGEMCQHNSVCEKNCPATVLETSCGPIETPDLNSHSSYDTFSLGRTQSISCHNGELSVQITGDFCPQVCGDGQCKGLDENCTTCPIDCGSCSAIEPSNIISPLTTALVPDGSGRRPTTVRAPTKLDSPEVVFEWSTGYGLGTQFKLEVGTCLDEEECKSDIFYGVNPPYLFVYPEPDLAEAFPNVSPYSHRVTGIPLDGNPVYVHLTQFDGEDQYITAYQYDTINLNPHITNPDPDSILNSRRVDFTCGGENVDICYFIVSSSLNARDSDYQFYGYQIGSFDPDYITPNYINTINLPLDGSTVYVRVFHWNNDWQNFGRFVEEYESIHCGDGVVSEGEACDDGNIENDDGCSDSCQYELPTIIIPIPRS